ncbi:hypothetical protein ACFL49_03295, partial [Candidatus Omnitrophota bacterium]
MTIPKDDLWVNLSPYESDRIIPEELGKTALGRDLLAQDYILKQLTATMMHPESELGEKFWSKVRAEAKKQFGTDDVPTDTFNKVWILPESATVYEHEQTVYVVDSKLKVMTDSDYQAYSEERTADSQNDSLTAKRLALNAEITKEIIIPAIEKEVNTGKNFAPLRQIYHSLILAKWYKQTIKNSLLSKVYVNQGKVAGVELDDKTFKEGIYDQYMQAYKKGVFNFIKEDYDALSQQVIPRKYFSGGFKDSAMVTKQTKDYAQIAASIKHPFKLSMKITPQKNGAPVNIETDKAMLQDIKRFIPGTLPWAKRLIDFAYTNNSYRFADMISPITTVAEKETNLDVKIDYFIKVLSLNDPMLDKMFADTFTMRQREQAYVAALLRLNFKDGIQKKNVFRSLLALPLKNAMAIKKLYDQLITDTWEGFVLDHLQHVIKMHFQDAEYKAISSQVPKIDPQAFEGAKRILSDASDKSNGIDIYQSRAKVFIMPALDTFKEILTSEKPVSSDVLDRFEQRMTRPKMTLETEKIMLEFKQTLLKNEETFKKNRMSGLEYIAEYLKKVRAIEEVLAQQEAAKREVAKKESATNNAQKSSTQASKVAKSSGSNKISSFKHKSSDDDTSGLAFSSILVDDMTDDWDDDAMLSSLAAFPTTLIGALEETGQILSVKAGEVFETSGDMGFIDQMLHMGIDHSRITIGVALARGFVYKLWNNTLRRRISRVITNKGVETDEAMLAMADRSAEWQAALLELGGILLSFENNIRHKFREHENKFKWKFIAEELWQKIYALKKINIPNETYEKIKDVPEALAREIITRAITKMEVKKPTKTYLLNTVSDLLGADQIYKDLMMANDSGRVRAKWQRKRNAIPIEQRIEALRKKTRNIEFHLNDKIDNFKDMIAPYGKERQVRFYHLYYETLATHILLRSPATNKDMYIYFKSIEELFSGQIVLADKKNIEEMWAFRNRVMQLLDVDSIGMDNSIYQDRLFEGLILPIEKVFQDDPQGRRRIFDKAFKMLHVLEQRKDALKDLNSYQILRIIPETVSS